MYNDILLNAGEFVVAEKNFNPNIFRMNIIYVTVNPLKALHDEKFEFMYR